MPARSLLPEEIVTSEDYRRADGYVAYRQARENPTDLRKRLGSCTLTGLGGAHFPFARKMQLALAASGPRVVVCNAAEDEPGSQKDRLLLERNPHVVLEGALIAATAVEAGEVYFYVSDTLIEATAAIRQACADLVAADGLADGLQLRVVAAPQAYVAGEASAAVRLISGGEAKPTEQPPYPTESGVLGRPTLVSNCETLANLPRLLADCDTGAWTRLATVTGDVMTPGVFEIDPDRTTFGDIISLAGGLAGPSPVLKAIQPGGPSSAFLPGDGADVLLNNSAIVAAGSQPGCLAIRVLSQARCLVEEVADLTAFFAREQCGQCPPCRMKTQAYAKTLDRIRHGTGDWALVKQLDAVNEFVSDMPRRCALISMPTAPVASALALFREDFEAHIEQRQCRAQLHDCA